MRYTSIPTRYPSFSEDPNLFQVMATPRPFGDGVTAISVLKHCSNPRTSLDLTPVDALARSGNQLEAVTAVLLQLASYGERSDCVKNMLWHLGKRSINVDSKYQKGLLPGKLYAVSLEDLRRMAEKKDECMWGRHFYLRTWSCATVDGIVLSPRKTEHGAVEYVARVLVECKNVQGGVKVRELEYKWDDIELPHDVKLTRPATCKKLLVCSTCTDAPIDVVSMVDDVLVIQVDLITSFFKAVKPFPWVCQQWGATVDDKCPKFLKNLQVPSSLASKIIWGKWDEQFAGAHVVARNVVTDALIVKWNMKRKPVIFLTRKSAVSSVPVWKTETGWSLPQTAGKKKGLLRAVIVVPDS